MIEKQKPRTLRYGVLYIFNLAMPYSHMGKPHTTIGITAFYF